MLTRAGVAAVLALAAVGVSGTATFAATTTTQTVMTLSSATGPQGGGNTLTLSLPTTATAKFTNTLVGIQFQSTTAAAAATANCSAAPATTGQVTAAGTLRYISNTKVSVVVPDLSTLASSSSYFLVCAYNAAQSGSVIPTSATVVGKANYIASVPPTLKSSGAIVPGSGPASGGQVVTVYSSANDFPSTITAATPLSATLGGLPLTNITPLGTGAFSAVTPARPASSTAVVLSVTTAGGTVTKTSAYTYVNGITVSPNTVAPSQSTDVDITGTGFSGLAFQTTGPVVDWTDGAGTHPDSAHPHVYLVSGAYHNQDTGSSAKTNGETSECVNVVVISDNELICTVNAAKSVVAGSYTATALSQGTYTLTVVDTGAVSASSSADDTTYQTALSSGATFTVANF